MRAVTSEHRRTPHRIWFIAPLGVFALVTLTIGALAHRGAGGYPAPPFFHLFFSDTLHLKTWLATGVSMLAVFQLLTAARTFDVFHFPPSKAFLGARASSLWLPGHSVDTSDRLSLYLLVGI
jgi:Family of unknown function (DUF6529)